MESPAKKLQLDAQADKENILDAKYESCEVAVPIKGIPEQAEDPKDEEPAVTKDGEEIEPILQENAQRFVLFPIKYHEVRVTSCLSLRVLHA